MSNIIWLSFWDQIGAALIASAFFFKDINSKISIQTYSGDGVNRDFHVLRLSRTTVTRFFIWGGGRREKLASPSGRCVIPTGGETKEKTTTFILWQ